MMKKLLLSLILLVSLCVGRILAQEGSAIPGLAPNLYWDMPPATFQENAPGTFEGQMYIQQQDFYGYASAGQYYFDAQGLRWVILSPHYRKSKAAEWQPEYQHLQRELTNLYGEPVNTTPYQWQDQRTAATLLLLQQGWMTRFDARPQEGQ